MGSRPRLQNRAAARLPPDGKRKIAFTPRTFSLARLMLGITLLCILFGLAASYRVEALLYALLVASLAPSGLVCLTLVSFSTHRKEVLAASLFGAAAGLFLCCPLPLQSYGGGAYPSVWHAIVPVFVPIAIHSTLGAFFFGTAALVINALDAGFHGHKP